MTINNDLIKFISLYTEIQDLNISTEISYNILRNESEAYSFIHEYAKTFDIDISNLSLDKYINNLETNEYILTIGDLQRGIELGILNDSIIETDEYDMELRPKFSNKNIMIGIVVTIITTILLCFVAIYY